MYGLASSAAYLATQSAVWIHLSEHVRMKFLGYMHILIVVLWRFGSQLYISALSPILWYMWVQSGKRRITDKTFFPCVSLILLLRVPIGTGNSNFYYALTLVQAIAAGWLVSNLLSAILEHDYRRKHNLPLE